MGWDNNVLALARFDATRCEGPLRFRHNFMLRYILFFLLRHKVRVGFVWGVGWGNNVLALAHLLGATSAALSQTLYLMLRHVFTQLHALSAATTFDMPERENGPKCCTAGVAENHFDRRPLQGFWTCC